MSELPTQPFPLPPDGLRARQPKAIHSALTVLEEVARAGAGVTAQELSQRLGLPRATTYRLITALVEDEYLVRMPDLKGFTLGHKVVELAHRVAPVSVPEAAATVVAHLRARIRGGVHLVRYEGERLDVVDIDPDFPLSDPERIHKNLTESAMGRLLLVELDRRGALPPTTAVSAGRIATLRREISIAGYAHQTGNFAPGFGCIAVPIRRKTGDLIASITLAVPAARIAAPGDAVRILQDGAVDMERVLAP